MTTQEGEWGSEGGDQLTQTPHSNHGDTLETNPYGPMGPTFKVSLDPQVLRDSNKYMFAIIASLYHIVMPLCIAPCQPKVFIFPRSSTLH